MPSRLATSIFIFAAILATVNPIVAICVAAVALVIEVVAFFLISTDEQSYG